MNDVVELNIDNNHFFPRFFKKIDKKIDRKALVPSDLHSQSQVACRVQSSWNKLTRAGRLLNILVILDEHKNLAYLAYVVNFDNVRNVLLGIHIYI